MFLKRLACQCATKWPSLRSTGGAGLEDQAAAQRGADAADGEEVGAGQASSCVGTAFFKSLQEGEAEGLDAEGEGGNLSESALATWLLGLQLAARPARCALILNTEAVLFADARVIGPSREAVEQPAGRSYGEGAGAGGGRVLSAEAMLNLQRVISISGAELVLSGPSRASKASREALAQTLGRWGVHFTRWTTTADKQGGRGAQILDFVTRHLQASGGGDEGMPWAVVDGEKLGKEYDEEGALMMEVLLRQQSVLVGADGYSDELARATLHILMGEDE